MKFYNSRPILFLLFLLISTVTSSPDVHKCGACKMLVEEVEHEINSMDPKKTIKVGSYRVGPNGDQYLEEVPYARSDEHLHELIEHGCIQYSKYGLATELSTGRQGYMRLYDHNGDDRYFESIDKSDKIQSKLKFNCENILEDYEEALLEMLATPSPDLTTFFCRIHTDLCTVEYLAPIPFKFKSEVEEKEDDLEENTGSDEL